MRVKVVKYKIPNMGNGLLFCDWWDDMMEVGRGLMSFHGAKSCTHKLGYGDVPRTEFCYD